MSNLGTIDVDSITAIDVHVHIEHSGEESAADRAAKTYFGDSGVTHDRRALAEAVPALLRLAAHLDDVAACTTVPTALFDG